jgi:hypothetical protein
VLPSALVLILALALAPPSGVKAQEPVRLLDQVVDSLPHFIGLIWGYEEHQPYSVVLSAHLLGQQLLDGPELPKGSHDQRWLARQAAKPFVREVCSAGYQEPHRCPLRGATMAAALSSPPIDGEEATVQVRIWRLGYPEGPERWGFFAGFLVRFVCGSSGWEYQGYRVIEIT